MAQHIAFGSSLLVDLADDILDVIGSSLSPRDICNVSMCCNRLNARATFDKFWLTQCEELGVLSSTDIVEWRGAVSSYKALCRFLTSVKPLLGVWVHQNPELGNVVYVMPGFASVVGCRVIPQKLGPSGIDGSPILWAPVFEVISDNNGAPCFILHGRDNGQDYIYPGTMKSIEKSCDVLLLEVEPKEKNRDHLLFNESLHCHSDEEMDRKVLSTVRESDSSANIGHDTVSEHRTRRTGLFSGKLSRFWSKMKYRSVGVSDTRHTSNLKCRSNIGFNKLSFEDTEELLKLVACGVGIQVPDPPCASLFPCLRGEENRFRKDIAHLSERRKMLIKMPKLGGGCIDWTASHEQQFLPNQKDESKNKDAEVCDFLTPGDAVGLTLQAPNMKILFYKTWPYMHYNVFALYKLPVQVPTVALEYAGLWGGTFGWPLGKKPGKSLFFLNLCYYEKSGKRRLLANKILEGTNYAKHPNGSAMFTVNVDKPSTESFPWSSGADSLPVVVKQAFIGKGIADGYGFRYPSSKPGSLFAIEDGLLAFVWEEPRSVMTLQRINLVELLKKGERVPALLPIDNFAYLSRSYSNKFVDLQT